MAHFAILCPPYPGHLNPMLALAAGLLARGQSVTFVGQPDVAPFVRRPGLGFAPVGVETHGPGTLARMTARLGRTTGLLGVGAVIRDIARTTDMLCREAPGVLRRIGAEALVVDQTEPAGGLVARHLGLPQVSVANALLINREPLVPPPFTDWRYDDSEWGRRRNLGGYRVADLLMAPLGRVIARWARAWSLGPLATMDDCLSPTLQLSQTVPGFDVPRRAAPRSLVHVGPLREAETRDWPAGDGRPLVFCSLGTLQGGRLPVFRAVAEACQALDLGLVVAHGGKLDAAQAATLAGAATVSAFVPQRAVLRRAAAVVTHGGLNTTLDALAASVPLVVVPLAFEQGAIAARVERCGAGRVLGARRATAGRMRAALAEVLSRPGYRRCAASLGDEISAAGGVDRAVELVLQTMAAQPAATGSSQPR